MSSMLLRLPHALGRSLNRKADFSRVAPVTTVNPCSEGPLPSRTPTRCAASCRVTLPACDAFNPSGTRSCSSAIFRCCDEVPRLPRTRGLPRRYVTWPNAVAAASRSFTTAPSLCARKGRPEDSGDAPTAEPDSASGSWHSSIWNRLRFRGEGGSEDVVKQSDAHQRQPGGDESEGSKGERAGDPKGPRNPDIGSHEPAAEAQHDRLVTAASSGSSATQSPEPKVPTAVATLKQQREFLSVLGENMQDLGATIEGWSADDLSIGIGVLARIGQASRVQGGTVLSPPPFVSRVTDLETIEELRRMIELAHGAYCRDDKELVDTVQGIEFISGSWETVAREFSQSHFLAVDHETKSVVLSIRGSYSAADAAICSLAAPDPFEEGFVHRGVLKSATSLQRRVEAKLHQALRDNPGHRPVIVGHSLGGGTATLLALLLKEGLPDLRAFTFNAPPILSLAHAQACNSFVTTVVNGDDVVSRLHVVAFEALRRELADVNWRDVLRDMAVDEMRQTRMAHFARTVRSQVYSAQAKVSGKASKWLEDLDAKISELQILWKREKDSTLDSEAIATVVQQLEELKSSAPKDLMSCLPLDAESAETVVKQQLDGVRDAISSVGEHLPSPESRQRSWEAVASRVEDLGKSMKAMKVSASSTEAGNSSCLPKRSAERSEEHSEPSPSALSSFTESAKTWLGTKLSSRDASRSLQDTAAAVESKAIAGERDTKGDTEGDAHTDGSHVDVGPLDMVSPAPLPSSMAKLQFYLAGECYHIAHTRVGQDAVDPEGSDPNPLGIQLWKLDMEVPASRTYFGTIILTPNGLRHHLASSTEQALDAVIAEATAQGAKSGRKCPLPKALTSWWSVS